MMFILQVLLFIFSIIRRNVWDYGRLALLADHEGLVHELTWFIDPWNFLWFLWSDLFCKSEICPSGSTIHHAVAMDTCHPLMSMNWYVKQHLKHQFYLQTFFISDHISCEAPIEHSLISFFRAVALGCLSSSEWSEWLCSLPVLHSSTNHYMPTIYDLTMCVCVFQWRKSEIQMWCGCCSLLVLSASPAHPSDGVNGFLPWHYTACQPVWKLAG